MSAKSVIAAAVVVLSAGAAYAQEPATPPAQPQVQPQQ